MRACVLELNVLCHGKSEKKFEQFREMFGEVFDKNTFKRKSDDLTAFVKKMSFCKGEKRTKYLKTFGIESWSSLPSKEEHTLKCKVCVPVPHLFKEPTKKRSKKNKHNIKTPLKVTPDMKKKTSRRDIQRMNMDINNNGELWEKDFDTPFVEVLRKNRKLNLTPRKSRKAKARERDFVQKRVSISHNFCSNSFVFRCRE